MLSNIRKVSKGPLGYSLRLLALGLGLVLIVAACGGPETVAPMAPETEVVALASTTPTAPDAERVAPGLTPSATLDMDGIAPVPAAPATPVAESVTPTPIPTPTAATPKESVAPTPIQSAKPEGESVTPEPTAPATPEAESVDPEPTAPATPEAESVDPETAALATPNTERIASTPTAPATPAAESVAPEATPPYSIHPPMNHGPPAHYGAATPSVEERIYDSDVIIRVSLQSSGSGSLHFRAIEYLKGAGPADIVVRAHTYERNTAWDDREAVLFLSMPEDQATSGTTGSAGEVAAGEFVFTKAYNYVHPIYAGRSKLPTGYTIDTRDPAWLPAEVAAGASGATGESASEPAFVTDSAAAAGGPSPTISLSDLRAKIAWVEGGEGIEGYDRCIRSVLDYKRWYRDWEAYYGTPWTPYQSEAQVSSGVGEGTVVDDYGSVNEPGYRRFWLTGSDAVLFQAQIVDDDEVASNGYTPTLATARPLPDGVYRFLTHFHRVF